MKKLLFVLGIALAALSACNFGDDGLPGDAFIRLNWEEKEPTYIDAGGVVPNKFAWDTYYKTRPGEYSIYLEYKRSHSHADVVEPYEIAIEIFVIEGELGKTHNRKGRDADKDVFFDLTFFPDGDIDFTHEIVKRKYVEDSEADENKGEQKSAVAGKTLIQERTDAKNGYGLRCSVYRLPAKEK